MPSPADTDPARPAPERSGSHVAGQLVWPVFVWTWAAAALFHLAGNPRLAPPWGRALLGVTALVVLARPRDPRNAVPLAVAVLATVWLEAPRLANHWLLEGFLAVVVLGAALGSGRDAARAGRRLVGPVRLVLLSFYGFAAFAKLNTDFFDPTVSCAVFYLRESAGSWGFAGLVEGLPDVAARAVALTVVGIEIAIPVLLVARRTRTAGVLVALGFHFVLALDRSHQFFDFSSVLLACFLVFLPPDVLGAAVGRLGRAGDRIRARWPSGPELLGLGLLAAGGLVVLAAAGPADWPAPPVLREVGLAVWLVYGSVVGVVVFRAVGGIAAVPSEASPDARLVPAATPRWLWIIPFVAVLNGLTPYVEVKSAFGWNMYANLAVVDGRSNHLVVRRGLPLTAGHERLVEVVSAGTSGLDGYVGSPWRLPEPQLVDHLARRPDAAVVGMVDGARVVYRGRDATARPQWQQKVQVFRAVDVAGPVACQPFFGPAG